jgi:hypothetical protein
MCGQLKFRGSFIQVLMGGKTAVLLLNSGYFRKAYYSRLRYYCLMEAIAAFYTCLMLFTAIRIRI